MAENAGAYSLTWEQKPLGFSIVMDTTGKNAYVSSIQKESNKQNGLKLAAQIIEINGYVVKNLDHKVILGKIKSATLPITLVFQPRSFANDPQNNVLKSIEFVGATVNKNRINGFFELVTGDDEMYNGRHQWQRNDDEEDPIVLWFWPSLQTDPKSTNNTGNDLWMIGRRSFRNTQHAYACCNNSEEQPTDINSTWKCYDPVKQKYIECKIKIQQKSAGQDD